MKKYYPYPTDKDGKKYFIITNTGKRVYFGDMKTLQLLKTKEAYENIKKILKKYI
jgi:hypothetical protein